MSIDLKLKDPLAAITERIVATYGECGAIHHLGHSPLPSYREVDDILADLREILYPGYGRRQNLHVANVAYHVGDLIDGLVHLLLVGHLHVNDGNVLSAARVALRLPL